MSVPAIAIAGGNPAKTAALKRLAAVVGARCIPRVRVDVDESGPTFADNARAKARAASRSIPAAFVLASDGGLEIPSLAGVWNPLHTSRFAVSDSPREKARRLVELVTGRNAEERAAYWIESLAVARDDCVLACWTVRGPSCTIARTLPEISGHFWVDDLLQPSEPGPGHWERLTYLFSDFWLREGGAP